MKITSIFKMLYNSSFGIKNIKLLILKSRLKKKAIYVDNTTLFCNSSMIALKDGSTKNDVIIESKVDIFGRLVSSHHGKIIMHEYSKIGPNSTIISVNRVEIGRDTAIAAGVTIIDNNTHPINPEDRRKMRHSPHGSDLRTEKYSANAPIVIGQNVWIGTGSRICKGVTIGDNAIVAAMAVVTKDVPANSIAAGNPARIVKTDIDKLTRSIFNN